MTTLCVAAARPRVHTLVASDRATIVLVLDVSGSMQANDVKPTRLAAAQQAIHVFLDRVPKRVRVGLILFAGVPEEATPPTTDHALVAQAVDDADVFQGGFGGTAIGDALAAAVKVGIASAGIQGTRGLAAYHPVAAPSQASTLVTILFLSDGHQNRGLLQPLQGAAVAKKAGIPVFTVALGTLGAKITNFNFGGGYTGTFFGGGPGLRQALAPDPATLHAIATATGGKFYPAKSAGAVRGRVREARLQPRPHSRSQRGDGGLRHRRGRAPARRRHPRRALGAAPALEPSRGEDVLERRAQADREGAHEHGAVAEARDLAPRRIRQPLARAARGRRRAAGRRSRRCRRRGRRARRR